ncbi:integrase [Paraburkholderia sp. HP33-1]|uniref:integrase n=1 Tax=Paraburkholderia sp. HP33-1 TaxID=2883243 RepID=UPI001F33B957|nr:integrase [Paraburkholderia sp. HP33-1]
MTEIITFVPRAELDAQQNLDAFVDACRSQLTIFGANLDFEANKWVTGIELKGKYHPLRLTYSNLETCKKRELVMMEEPFRTFSKAFMRYQQGVRPTKAVGNRLAALRVIEAALVETGMANPLAIDADVLNRAAQLAQARFAPANAYRVGTQIEMVGTFLTSKRLTVGLSTWHNPIKRPGESDNKVGEDADAIRISKLPSPAALDALPQAFRLARKPADVLVSSVTAIFVSAPDRISEVLLLAENCEHTEPDEDGTLRYGLRWFPAKGAEPMIKWIVPSMVDVVKEAIARIRKLTAEARKVARWYETHPGKIYLATDELKKLRRKKWLTAQEVGDILFACPAGTNAVRTWCKANGVPFQEGQPQKHWVRLEDLQSAVLRQLPPGFPVMNKALGLKYSEALCVLQRNALATKQRRSNCLIDPIGQNIIHNRLGSRSTTGVESVFDSCGLFEQDGSPIRVHSHQFRHYVDTLAQMGGMSQLDIAKWAGRKDVRQNEVYDHESTQALLKQAREIVGNSKRMSGPVVASARRVLIERNAFGNLKIPTAHTTDFGYCVHDFVMTPCPIHGDCANCDEQVCIKGDLESETRIRQSFSEATRLLDDAERAAADGDYGAAEWVKHHRAVHSKLAALVAVLDNPLVPVGAVIRSTPEGVASWLERAQETRDQAQALDDTPLALSNTPSAEVEQ